MLKFCIPSCQHCYKYANLPSACNSIRPPITYLVVVHRLDVELIQHIPPRARLLLLPLPLRLFHSAQVVGRIHVSRVPASDLLRLESFPVGATRQVTLLFRQPRPVVRVCDRGYGFVGKSKGISSGHRGNGWSGCGSLVLGLDGRIRGASRLEGFFMPWSAFHSFPEAQLGIMCRHTSDCADGRLLLARFGGRGECSATFAAYARWPQRQSGHCPF